MQTSKHVLKKENAMDIWKNRHLFQLRNFTVADLVRIYLKLYPANHFRDRKKHYISFMRTFQKSKIRSLNTTLLQAWFQQSKEDNNLTEKSLHHIKCQLNSFFKWLTQEKIIITNPLDVIKFRQNIQSLRQRSILSCDELKQLSDKAYRYSKNGLHPILYTFIHTGARKSEVLNLKWENIDFENNLMIFARTKNGETRKIQMSYHLRKMLKQHPRKSPYVFTNEKGDPASIHIVKRMIDNFKKLNPIAKNWTAHDFRHSFAFNFLLKGGEMYQLQAILGHKSIKMTVDLYGNLKAHNIKNPSPYKF